MTFHICTPTRDVPVHVEPGHLWTCRCGAIWQAQWIKPRHPSRHVPQPAEDHAWWHMNEHTR